MSKQFVRIYPVVNEFLDASNSSVAISCIGNSEPFAGGVEDLTGGCTLGDELVDHQWDKELGFQVLHVLGVAEELAEISLAMLEVVGCEAPHVH